MQVQPAGPLEWEAAQQGCIEACAAYVQHLQSFTEVYHKVLGWVVIEQRRTQAKYPHRTTIS